MADSNTSPTGTSATKTNPPLSTAQATPIRPTPFGGIKPAGAATPAAPSAGTRPMPSVFGQAAQQKYSSAVQEKIETGEWFNPDELVNVQGKPYPLVGGRLRLAHAANQQLSISADIVEANEKRVVMRATIVTDKGTFKGYGAADTNRDRRLADAILELAETRAIARALRFAGYGVEFTGAEEASKDPVPVQSEPAAAPA